MIYTGDNSNGFFSRMWGTGNLEVNTGMTQDNSYSSATTGIWSGSTHEFRFMFSWPSGTGTGTAEMYYGSGLTKYAESSVRREDFSKDLRFAAISGDAGEAYQFWNIDVAGFNSVTGADIVNS